MKNLTNNKSKKIAMLLSFIWITSMQVIAQTSVSGLISADAIWTLSNSPYILTGSVSVQSDATLIIEPGVTVKFNSGNSLLIDGTLLAKGTINNKITFTSNTVSSAGAWGYIYFTNKSTDAVYTKDGSYKSGSILEYCTIQYAGGVSVSDNGALRIQGAHPLVNFCEISNNSTTGIAAFRLDDYRNGILKITNSVINNNTSSSYGGGISISRGAALISGNKISNNTALVGIGGGIYISDAIMDTITIYRNIVINNNATKGYGQGGGICSFGGSGNYSGTTNISDNIIQGNNAKMGGGICCFFSIINVSNNIITNNNVIADKNSSNAGGIGGGIYEQSDPTVMINNQIIRNSSNNDAGISYNGYGGANDVIKSNTISYNINTDVTNVYNRSFYIKSTFSYLNINNNNIFNNSAFYELYNDNPQGPQITSAANNWWGTKIGAEIEAKIYDFFDDGKLSILTYSPFLSSPDISAPVSPSVNVVKTDLGGGKIELTWKANTETDIAGYKVYYGSPTGYSFSNFKNVGNQTTYTLSGVSFTDTIAVTAYDSQMDGVNDMFEGHESWFTNAVGKPAVNFSGESVFVCPADTVYFVAGLTEAYSYTNTTYSWNFPGGIPAASIEKNPKVVFDNSGVYTVKLKITNIAGSDSLIRSNYITVTSVDTTVTILGNSIYSNAIATYQWLNCDNGNSAIAGEINQRFTPTKSGNYAVRITQNDCTNTSSCYNVTAVGIPEISNEILVSLHPNPVTKILNIEFWKVIKHAEIFIIDSDGKVVTTLSVRQTNKVSIDMSHLDSEVYFIRTTFDNNRTTINKIIKN